MFFLVQGLESLDLQGWLAWLMEVVSPCSRMFKVPPDRSSPWSHGDFLFILQIVDSLCDHVLKARDVVSSLHEKGVI